MYDVKYKAPLVEMQGELFYGMQEFECEKQVS